MKKVSIALGLAVTIFNGSAGAADKQRHTYQPVGPWTMQYTDDACRLVRIFADGSSQITAVFKRYDISPAMVFELSGNTLRDRSRASKAKFRYLPDGDERESGLARTQTADGQKSFQILSASLISRDQGRAIVQNWQGAASLAEFARAEEAAAAKTTSILISGGFKDVPVLNLGPMAEPIKAMQTCATDLVKSWGVDPEAVAAMSRPPEPLNSPSDWLNLEALSTKLPDSIEGGLIMARLIISPAGNVDACHFQIANPGEFEGEVCQSIKAHARFKPALDAQGQPMRTYWTQNIDFLNRIVMVR